MSRRNAMPRCCCFLCASDEGLFLEITTDNIRAAFGGQIEACLSKKVRKSIELSNKICYKCAYELDHCAKFLQKCKKSHETVKLLEDKEDDNGEDSSVPHCSLCCESVESSHIFDITEDNRSVFSPLQKIRRIFNDDLAKKVKVSKLICLVCRYNLDVLYDLKKLHEETINNLEKLVKKELDYSGFPKVNTDVVNRKTTITTYPDTTVYGLLSSESETNDEMAPGKYSKKRIRMPRKKQRIRASLESKKQSVDKPKSRKCDQCCNVVANGKNMYRLHQTGQTVCKNCWITMDPNKDKTERNIRNSLAETKLCTVFLKDVLSEGSHNDDNVLKIDGSSKMSDESDDTKSKSVSSQEEKKTTINGRSRRVKKRTNVAKSDAESTSSCTPRKMEKLSVTVSKTRSVKKALSDLDQPSTSYQSRSGRKRKIISDGSSDSDQHRRTPITKRIKKPTKDIVILSSTSEGDESVNSAGVRKTRKQRFASAVINASNESNGESSNENNDKAKRMKVSVDTKKSETGGKLKRGLRDRTKSVSSASSKEATPPAEFKSPKLTALPEEHVCDTCGKKFDTNLAQTEHKMMHLRYFTLRLEKVAVPRQEVEEEELEVHSQEDKTTSVEEPEAGSSGVTLSDRRSSQVDTSSEITLNVDDDTNEEVSLIKRMEASKNDDNKKDRLDGEGNDEKLDLQGFDKPKVQGDEEVASEAQRTTDVTDESATAKEENCDTKINDTLLDKEVKDTSNAQDGSMSEDTVVVVENDVTPDDKGKSEDVKAMDDDTEKTPAAEKEKPMAEEEEPAAKEKGAEVVEVEEEQEEEEPASEYVILDEANEDNEDRDNSCENKATNKQPDDDDENGEAKDTARCVDSITNELKMGDSVESLEKDKNVPHATNEREILNDKEDPGSESLEKWENTIDKHNSQVEDVETLENSVTSTMKSHLLNCDPMIQLHEDIEKNVADDMNGKKVSRSKFRKSVDSKITKDDENEASTECDIEQLMQDDLKCDLQENKKRELHENNTNNISTNAAAEIVEEVFDLAAAEVQKRRNSDGIRSNLDEDIEMETLENISREIRNSTNTPSLDPISELTVNDENDMQ